MILKAKIIVDADACPKNCLVLLQKERSRFGYRLITIASFNHVINNSEHITVGNEKEAADLAVINRVQAGDLVVTQDWGLAALVLGKGGKVLAPNGRIYHEDDIRFMLEERAVKAKIRRAGGRTKGPAARGKQDDQKFFASLFELLSQMD